MKQKTITMHNLWEAYLHFLSQKPAKKITVTEITKYACVNRGTFYLYYEDIYALKNDIETHLVTHISALVSDCFENNNNTENEKNNFVEKYLLLIKSHSDILSILFSSTGNELINHLRDILYFEFEHDYKTSKNRNTINVTEKMHLFSLSSGITSAWLLFSKNINDDTIAAFKKYLIDISNYYITSIKNSL